MGGCSMKGLPTILEVHVWGRKADDGEEWRLRRKRDCEGLWFCLLYTKETQTEEGEKEGWGIQRWGTSLKIWKNQES